MIKNFTKTKISFALLEKVEDAVLKAINVKKNDVEISLAVVGEKRMARLNSQWRGKSGPTNVLSFGFWEIKDSPKQKNKNKKKYIGEIIICAAIAEKQAKAAGHSFNEELAKLLIHGTLHLAGYEHEKSRKKAKEMEMMEEKILKLACR